MFLAKLSVYIRTSNSDSHASLFKVWNKLIYIDYPISFFTDRSQEIQHEGLLTDQAAGLSGLYQSGGTWNKIQLPTIPIQQVYIYIYIYIYVFLYLVS